MIDDIDMKVLLGIVGDKVVGVIVVGCDIVFDCWVWMLEMIEIVGWLGDIFDVVCVWFDCVMVLVGGC